MKKYLTHKNNSLKYDVIRKSTKNRVEKLFRELRVLQE